MCTVWMLWIEKWIVCAHFNQFLFSLFFFNVRCVIFSFFHRLHKHSDKGSKIGGKTRSIESCFSSFHLLSSYFRAKILVCFQLNSTKKKSLFLFSKARAEKNLKCCLWRNTYCLFYLLKNWWIRRWNSQILLPIPFGN